MPRTRSIAWSELKLGVVGITTLLLVATLVVAVGGQGGFWFQRYAIKTRFTDAQGLKAGAVVRLSGKEVGTVTSVEFAEGLVEVSMEVNDDVRGLITTESTASIGSLSLLGEPSVDIRMSIEGRSLAPGEYVRADESGAGLGGLTATASESLDRIAALLEDLRAGRGTLGQLLTDDTLLQEMETLVSSASEVTRLVRDGGGTVAGLLRDPEAYEAFKASAANLQAVTERIRNGEGALGRLLTDDAIGDSLAATSANLREATDRLARGEGTAGRLMTDTELYDRLTGMATEVERLVSDLDAGTGTAGQLLRDRRLYENMNEAVTELRALLADIRADPKRYLRVSVSIF